MNILPGLNHKQHFFLKTEAPTMVRMTACSIWYSALQSFVIINGLCGEWTCSCSLIKFHFDSRKNSYSGHSVIAVILIFLI